MDLLQEYEKNQSKAQLPSRIQTQDQLLWQRYAPDTGFFIRLVMRLSGGRIQNTRQASWVLFGVVAVIFVVSLFLFFGGISPSLRDIPVPLAGSANGK